MNIILPLKEIHPNAPIMALGLCQKCYFRQAYLKNKNNRLLQQKEYYKKNKKRICEREKIWREKNKEKVKLYHQRDLQKNYKRRRKIRKSLLLDSFYNAKARAKKEKIKFNLTKEQFLKLVLKGKKCFYCHNSKITLTLDRLIPSKGYNIKNIVIACWRCNTTKSDFFTSNEMLQIAKKFIIPKLK